ncbi:LANO_0F14466g1_1 [Lachancea nothofagi CBS 11611]|uniref:LANO_0F14466g1_1 n=1 Tax=Lachancea nothofagi CBS 11611 TaxID=1266666 RepID=A0A1G4KCB9_9SACH|nr:LANO_0F14466g1_1 [Lachancea nothofagi CBS 11611]
MLKTIDLNIITTEQELVPIIKNCLRDRGIFLLKNYANIEAVRTLLLTLKDEPPNIAEGLNQNFTGSALLENGVSVEQFVGNPNGTSFQKTALGRLTSRLIKIANFFANASLAAACPNESLTLLNDVKSCTKITRYHKSISKSILDLEFDYEDEYAIYNSPGVITVFPIAQGIKYNLNGKWELLDEPDCILIQTGDLLSHYSNNMHITEPIKFSTTNTTHLTVFPPLETMVGPQTISNLLLNNQIGEFPAIIQKLYPDAYAKEALKKRVEFCKNIFYVTDSVLSLYSISRSLLTSAPELYVLLPQISNMLKRKVSQEDFLRMMTIWNECYILEVNSNFEITIRPPPGGLLNALSSKSRKLEYAEKADKWFTCAISASHIPQNVPILSIKKRRGSDGSYEAQSASGDVGLTRPLAQPKKTRTSGYISNTKDKFMFREDKGNLGNASLLERIREKERRASSLLSQRERQHEQFLNVKTFQVFDILFSLPQAKPYTITHLTSLIVDSLADSNNPIGQSETHEVLSRLQLLLNDRINLVETEGSLKVFRWVDLDRKVLSERMNVQPLT